MTGLFITATGTDIGKTLVTCALAYQLRERKCHVRALKPVISGYDPQDDKTDTARLLAAQNLPQTAEQAAIISPWRFGAPLSPDMAAIEEGRDIPFEGLVDYCRKALSQPGFVLIEGVGGPFVPLGGGYLVADWMKALGCPNILVTGSYLGTISHTLGNYEALAARALAPKAVIVSQSEDEPVPLSKTIKTLKAHLPCPVHALPRLSGADPWRHAPDLLSLPGII